MASPATASDLPVGLADVEAAAARIEGAVVRTPTLFSRALSERLGATIYVKLENLQHVGAFKERGALNKLLLMDEATRARGVTTASASNHAQALAFHARRLGVPAVIVMPEDAPPSKRALNALPFTGDRPGSGSVGSFMVSVVLPIRRFRSQQPNPRWDQKLRLRSPTLGA